MAAVYLPQPLFLGLTAIFALGLVLHFAYKKHGYEICIVLGMLLGGLLFFNNQARNFAKVTPFIGEPISLTARVEDVSTSYIEGCVSATLRVKSVAQENVSFSCHVSLLPEAIEGECIEADFILSDLSQEETYRLSNYGDGIFAQAEYDANFQSLGMEQGVRGFFLALQQQLSHIIRSPFSDSVASVLAAMTVGDRSYLSNERNALYRKAGLSHILVVSGLHLSLVCALIRLPQTSAHTRKLRATLILIVAGMLVGVTGATLSVLRASVVLLFSICGNVFYEDADGYTSLGVAGLLLTCTNGYVVCNLSFQLSFLATFGVLLGASFVQEILERFEEIGLTHPWIKLICNNLFITLFASAATIPALILWQMNVSLLALPSTILVMWMIPFILIFGLVGAFIGLLPCFSFLSTVILSAAGILVLFLNKIVALIAQLPGGQLYFESEYAAIVCMVIFALAAVGYVLKIRLRFIIPSILCIFVGGIAIGNYFTQDITRISLVGMSTTPAVVITQQKNVTVLFRGGEYNAQAIENYLNKRGISKIALMVDLRMDPKTKCPLLASEERSLWEIEPHTEEVFSSQQMDGVLFRASDGGVVLLNIGGTTFATVSGTVTFSQDYPVSILLGGASDTGSVVGHQVLVKNNEFEWLEKYDAQNVYCGTNQATISVRKNGAYQFEGVKNGE